MTENTREQVARSAPWHTLIAIWYRWGIADAYITAPCVPSFGETPTPKKQKQQQNYNNNKKPKIDTQNNNKQNKIKRWPNTLGVGFYRFVNCTGSPQDNHRNKQNNKNLNFLSSVVGFFRLFCFKLQCTSDLKEELNMFTIPVTVWFFSIVTNGTSFTAISILFFFPQTTTCFKSKID